MRILAVNEVQFEALWRLSSPMQRRSLEMTCRNLYDYPDDTLYIVGNDVTAGSMDTTLDMNGTPYTVQLLRDLSRRSATERIKDVFHG